MDDMTIDLDGATSPEELASLDCGEREPDPVKVSESESGDDASGDAGADASGEQWIENPVTGQLVNLADLDSLILACDSTKEQLAMLKEFDKTLREQAWQRTQGAAKTRRLQGRKYTAKVVGGDLYPNGSMLKEAWNAYPQFRDNYLRIGSIQLKAVEAKKLANMTSDDPAFSTFAGMLKAAQDSGSVGLASVSLEKAKGGEG